MTDGPKLPEEPQGNTPGNKIPEGETWSQTVDRIRAGRRPKTPPKHFFEETEIEDLSRYAANKEPETQEERFRLAAIKLAMMEDEMSELLEKTPDDAFIENSKIYLTRYGNDAVSFRSEVEDFQGGDGKPTRIEFVDGICEHASELKIDTDKELFIWAHTDESTRDAYDAYAKKEPGRAKNAQTQYCFTKDGVYKKISYIPTGVTVDRSRKPLRGGGGGVNTYLSEMTAGDFEIAGQALVMLKKRLVPLIPQGESNNES